MAMRVEDWDRAAEVRKSGWDRRRGEMGLGRRGSGLGLRGVRFAPGFAPGRPVSPDAPRSRFQTGGRACCRPRPRPHTMGVRPGSGPAAKLVNGSGFRGSGETGEELAERLALSEGR